MALPGSVPLLLPLLTSAVAYEFQQLNDVVGGYSYITGFKTESECMSYCGWFGGCTGYKFDTSTSECQFFADDCRGPGVNKSQLTPDYHAKNTCPDPACGCPDGFHRYGTRCYGIPDQTAQNWDSAYSVCGSMDPLAEMAAPITQQEREQVALAAVQLQTAPALQRVWVDLALDPYFDGTNDWWWAGHMACGPGSQPLWVAGEPAANLRYGAYAPPGMSQAEGWYAQDYWDHLNVPLCELDACYRPDCPQ